MFSTFFILFFKISLCAETHLEASQTSTWLIIRSFPFQAEFLRLFSVRVSEAAVRRCSIIKIAKLVREVLSRVIERQKVRAKRKFVNRYSAAKFARLCMLWIFYFIISFKPSVTLFYWDIHQLVFLTWIHLHNLFFSIQPGFNYRLYDNFQLAYMQWKFQLSLFKPWVSLSTQDEISSSRFNHFIFQP